MKSFLSKFWCNTSELKLKVKQHSFNLRKLGTPYGGWTFIDLPTLKNSTIISCGLGEDASFDVEFSAAYQAHVIIVDPTPRAVHHFKEIVEQVGRQAKTSYVPGGKQPPSSYDLSKVTSGQLKLEPYALWNENKTLRFFSPPNKEHVSHSISNFQNDYKTDTDSIEVEAITMSRLLSKTNLKRIELLKLDIEGAEIEVLENMLEGKIFPIQILVEYDEIKLRSGKANSRIEKCHKRLLKSGYALINFDHPSNFLYTNLKV